MEDIYKKHDQQSIYEYQQIANDVDRQVNYTNGLANIYHWMGQFEKDQKLAETPAELSKYVGLDTAMGGSGISFSSMLHGRSDAYRNIENANAVQASYDQKAEQAYQEGLTAIAKGKMDEAQVAQQDEEFKLQWEQFQEQLRQDKFRRKMGVINTIIGAIGAVSGIAGAIAGFIPKGGGYGGGYGG